MLTITKTALSLATLMFSLAAPTQEAAGPSQSQAPQYTSDAQLQFPEHYREWVYLTSGFDMSYNPPMQMGDHHMFDNVFVNPAAYQAFTKTGTWPDKTMLVLEQRRAQGKGSINQQGNYQGTVMGLEVHVKDEARFPGKWAFFGFGDGGKTAKDDSNIDGLLQLPCRPCSGGHYIRPVLSNAVANRHQQEHALRRVPERECNTS